jgi:hypothetical protein
MVESADGDRGLGGLRRITSTGLEPAADAVENGPTLVEAARLRETC